MASVPKDQTAVRWRDRAFSGIGKFGRSRTVDFELGKPRAGNRTTRAKTADCRNRLRISGCLRRWCLKARLFHSAHNRGNRCYGTASIDWSDSIGEWGPSLDRRRATDFDRHHGGSFNVKDNPQVCFDLCRINDTPRNEPKACGFCGNVICDQMDFA